MTRLEFLKYIQGTKTHIIYCFISDFSFNFFFGILFASIITSLSICSSSARRWQIALVTYSTFMTTSSLARICQHAGSIRWNTAESVCAHSPPHLSSFDALGYRICISILEDEPFKISPSYFFFYIP